MPLPTTISPGDSAASHRAHHQSLHGLYNLFENSTPSSFAPALHTQTAATITDFATVVRSTVGAMFVDSGTIDFTYNSGAGTVTGAVIGAGAATEPGTVLLDDFAGANDSAKLTAAMSFAAAQSYPPVIALTNRLYTFTTKGVVPYEGFKIRGPGNGALQEAAGTASGRTSECLLAFESSVDGIGWIHPTTTAQCRNVSMENLNLKASGSFKPSFLTQGASAVWWLLSLTNISSDSLWSVCGWQSPTSFSTKQSLVITGIHFDGPGWNINNGYSTQFIMGGSDATLWQSGGFFDSPASRHPTTGNRRYLIWFDFMAKTRVGPIFLTCQAKWGGLYITGSNYNAGTPENPGGPITTHGMVVEGRNPGTGNVADPVACYGSVIRQDGGNVRHYGLWFGQGMSAPTISGFTHTSGGTDGGAYHAFGGAYAAFYAPMYERAYTDGTTTAIAETVPAIYASDSDTIVRVKDVSHGNRAGGPWAGLVRVQAANSAQVTASDGSYTLI